MPTTLVSIARFGTVLRFDDQDGNELIRFTCLKGVVTSPAASFELPFAVFKNSVKSLRALAAHCAEEESSLKGVLPTAGPSSTLERSVTSTQVKMELKIGSFTQEFKYNRSSKLITLERPAMNLGFGQYLYWLTELENLVSFIEGEGL